jgi:hypothetical protein
MEGRVDGTNNYVRLGGGRSEGTSMNIMEWYFGTGISHDGGTKKSSFDKDNVYFAQNVGIGVTSPQAMLHVNDGTSTSEDSGILLLSNYDTSFSDTQALGQVHFGGTRNNTHWGVGAIISAEAAEAWDADNEYGTDLFFRTAAIGASSTTVKMMITSEGNVGIGTDSPATKLELETGGVIDAQLRLTAANTRGASVEYISGQSSGSTYNWRVGSNIVNSNAFQFVPSTAADGTTFNTPAVSIKNTGNVGIGNASPTGNLEVRSAASSHCIVTVNTTDANYDASIILEEAGSEKWNIMNDADGHSGGSNSFVIRDRSDSSTAVHIAPGGTSFVSGSDERLKKDINNIGSVLDGINSLRPITYKRKYGILDITHPGLIAQEVKPYFPLTVLGEEDSFREISENEAEGGLSLAYQDLIPYLIKAVQELSAKVEALENA